MLIKQSDYHRIYSVVNSLIASEQGSPAFACMYFSTFGAFILKKHFKIDATPKGGLAAYRFNDDVLLFADHHEDGTVSGDGENFHCWVEADGWAVDFMTPALSAETHHFDIPPKMFQKRLDQMAPSVNDLKTSGDFYYVSEPSATARRFSDWQNYPMIQDLAELAVLWFRKSPKAIAKEMTMVDQHNSRKAAPLVGRSLVGTW
jgi:hypothetical protein